MIYEKKLWTNLFHSKSKNDLVSIGQYSDEKTARSKVENQTDESKEKFEYLDTVPATLQFEYVKKKV